MASSGSTSYSIRGHSVVFHEESHEYFVDGVKVPSVTEILGRYSRLHGLDDYADIPQDVLRRAAARGTALHKEIEEYEKQGVRGFSEEFGNYLPLKIRHGVKVVASELPVLIFDDSGQPVCAGRLDLLATINGDAALGDIKRTSRLYPKKVSLQLNLYRIGCIQSYGKACDRLFVMRLRKGVSEFREFPVDEKGARDVLKTAGAVLSESSSAVPENARAERNPQKTAAPRQQAHASSSEVNAAARTNVNTAQSRSKYYSGRPFSFLSPACWFTLKGRLSSFQFWIMLMIWSFALCRFSALFSPKDGHDERAWFIFVSLSVFFPVFLSICVRRNHDHNLDVIDDWLRIMFTVYQFCAVFFLISSFGRFLVMDMLNKLQNMSFNGELNPLETAGFMGLTAVVVTAIPLMAIQLVFLVLTGCTEGDKGENEYGPDPLEKKK